MSKIKRLLVTLNKPELGETNPYLDLAARFNLAVDFYPLTNLEEILPTDFRKFRINLNDFDSIIFSSKYSVEVYFKLCNLMRVDIVPESRYYCISEAVSNYLSKYTIIRKRKIFTGKGTLSSLMPFMAKSKESIYAFPCSETFEDSFLENTKASGLHVVKVPVFKTIINPLENLDLSKIDLICFFTPLSVSAFFSGTKGVDLSGLKFAVFGEQSKRTLQDFGYNSEVFAPTPVFPSLYMAISNYLKKVAR